MLLHFSTVDFVKEELRFDNTIPTTDALLISRGLLDDYVFFFMYED